MITALALVCGSSVIFFDPIFQGMAISLASGVLVSTVLTLIVIPLGCIAASKDLLEVAAATAPEGTQIAELEQAPQAVAKVSAEPSPGASAEPKADDGRPSLPARIWERVAGLAMLIFYLFRGLFLLLFQRLGRTEKPEAGGQIDARPMSDDDTGGDQGPGGTPPAPAQSGGQTEPPTSLAAKPSAQAASSATEETGAETAASKIEEPGEGAAAGSEAEEEAVSPSKAADSRKKTTAEPVTRQRTVKKKATPKPKKRPSTLKKQAKKKAASAKPKAESAPAARRKKPAPGGNGDEPHADRRDEVEEKRKAVSNVAPFPVRKRTPRRGIRLK
jgi:hypothetical protein